MSARLATCFGVADQEMPSTAVGPSFRTSIYETRLGPAALTWSRAAFGLALRVEFRLSDAEEEEPLEFSFRPSFLWRRRGSRRFPIGDGRSVVFSWDISQAVFSSGRSSRAEPERGFFVAAVIDGEMLLVAGDLVEEAYRKTRARRPKAPFLHPLLAARQEHAVLDSPSGRGTYCTVARCGGRDREISIDLGPKEGGEEAGMSVAVDGKRVFHVRCLRWKFRGSERLEIAGGVRMQLSWDLHDWLFQGEASAGRNAAARVRAVFLFQFEEEGDHELGNRLAKDLVFDEDSVNAIHKIAAFEEDSSKTKNWNGINSNNGFGGAERAIVQPGRRKRQLRRRLMETNSCSSSASSASTASSSTVMGWSSHEELELHRPEGFSLLVYIMKNC
ncbi:uncharacterized protein LOC121995131 [Zingiber officinale]|uniref:Uncharacterized protein n=1 Tax=Zingiber officinale TaxID=94328 RepID=A0A8J5G6G4_ZINOF|nr:uncharacterized protein LOC121995131 [Zingiber officinale]KAG6500751.1 hypothetical protein ZIOFF_040601 [Zingiber officinale]